MIGLSRLLLVAVFVGAFLMMSCDDGEARGEGEEMVTVISYNIGDIIPPRPDADQVYRVIEGMPIADVYLFQEALGPDSFEMFIERLPESPEGYHWVFDPPPSWLGILSAHPIESSRILVPGAALEAVISVGDGRKVRVVTVHLPSFRKNRNEGGQTKLGSLGTILLLLRETFLENDRSRAVDAMVLDAERMDPAIPVIIGGDFNTVPLTRAARRMFPQFRDALRGTGDYWTGTYTRISGGPRPRVDYIFYSQDLTVRRAFVHKETAGDHYPVYAAFDFQR